MRQEEGFRSYLWPVDHTIKRRNTDQFNPANAVRDGRIPTIAQSNNINIDRTRDGEKVSVQTVNKISELKTNQEACDEFQASLDTRHFHSLIYALDTMVPFLNMSLENEWRLMDPKRFESSLPCPQFQESEDLSIGKESFYVFIVIVKLIGWALITTIAISLIARLESLLNRQNYM